MKTVIIACCFLLMARPVLQSQNAPVLTTGRVTTAVPGDPSVPVAVTVAGFINIGQFTLTMKFDTTRVRFVSASANPSLGGMSVNYIPPSGNTQGKLVFTWTGASNTSLPDGSSLASLTFRYITGTGMLNWAYTFGSVCQFKTYNGGNLNLLNDLPRYIFYNSGGISNRSAPVTLAPVIADPVPGPVPVPVIVNGFTEIGAFTLYLEYDPSVITYAGSYSANPALGTDLQVGDNPGSGGKRLLVMQWFGNALGLADGATVCTLNFNYPAACCNASSLDWFDNGPSCEYSDGPGDVLIDMPQSAYYQQGVIASGLRNTWTGNISSDWDNPGNWNSCGIPDISRDIIIPDVSPRSFPVVTTAGYCKSVRIESGATVTIRPSGSITVGNNEPSF